MKKFARIHIRKSFMGFMLVDIADITTCNKLSKLFVSLVLIKLPKVVFSSANSLIYT